MVLVEVALSMLPELSAGGLATGISVEDVQGIF